MERSAAKYSAEQLSGGGEAHAQPWEKQMTAARPHFVRLKCVPCGEDLVRIRLVRFVNPPVGVAEREAIPCIDGPEVWRWIDSLSVGAHVKRPRGLQQLANYDMKEAVETGF